VSVYGEVPTPAANGTATVFTLSQPYAAGTTRVYVNELRYHGGGVQYTETSPSAGTLTFATAPASGAVILVDYDIQATATTTATGTWTFNPDGFPTGSVMYYGPVLWLSGSEPGSTGTGVCVFGPNGGQISVPAMAAGPAGQSVNLTVGSVQTLPAGSPVTFQLVETNPGGSGIAAQYTVNVGIPQGEAGPAFATQILNASDLTGTPAQGYTIVYVPAQGSAPAQMAYAAMPFSSVYNVINIPNTGTSGGSKRTLATRSIPAQPFLWVPDPKALSTVNGTVNTQVNLVARLNNGSDAFHGTMVGLGEGLLGTALQSITAIQAFDTLIQGDTGTPVIPANTAVTVYLNAEEQTGTLDQYSTSNTYFDVGIQPLGIIPTSGVADDLVGTGLNVATSSGSFSFTIGANDNYLVFGLCGASTTSLLLLTPTVTFGGQTMDYLGGTEASTGVAFTALFGLKNPPTGPQRLSVSVTGGTVTGLVGTCVSFEFWAQTSGIYSTGGDSTAIATDSVYLSPSQMAIAGLVSYGSGAITPSGASGSVLYQKSAAGNGSLNFVLMVAQGTGGNVQLTGSTTAAQPWATALVTLI
jgi:hypothetical protein